MSYAARGPGLPGIDARTIAASPRWLVVSSLRGQFLMGAA